MTKLKGKNVPKKNKNEETHSKANAGSFRGLTNSMITSGLGFGVRRDLTVKLAMTSIPKIRKATALIVQGNPICGMSFETIIGNMTPPREDPDAITPKAVALFL